MISLADATTAQTEAQILTALLADMAAEGVDASGFSPFSVARVLPSLDARALAFEQDLRARLAKAGFLDLAQKVGDDFVEAIVNAWFRITRIPNTKGRCLFRVTVAPSAGTIAVGARELVADGGGGVLFDNVENVEINAGASKLVLFECRTRGVVGNVLPGAVTGFQVGRSGLSVTNAAESGAIVTYAGREKEPLTDFVARGRAKFAAKSYGGARAAYLVWVHEAFEAIGLDSPITKIGVDDANPNGPGSTDVYVADSIGTPSGTIIDTIYAFLSPRRAVGTGPLRVIGAPELVVPIAARLHVDGNSSAVADSIDRLQALQAAFPLGGGRKPILYTDAIRGALLGPDGVTGVEKIDLYSPAEDVGLTSPYQVVKFTYSIEVAP